MLHEHQTIDLVQDGQYHDLDLMPDIGRISTLRCFDIAGDLFYREVAHFDTITIFANFDHHIADGVSQDVFSIIVAFVFDDFYFDLF